MNYTIASTRNYDGMETVHFDKHGNKYLVGYIHKASGEYTHKTFDTLLDALFVYQQFVSAFITGDYSYDDRKSWLAESEVD